MKRKIPAHLEESVLNSYKQLMSEVLYLSHAVLLLEPKGNDQDKVIALVKERSESVTNMVINSKPLLQRMGAI